ncbi:MAG: carboxypeptidase-like regulatory domain-containing protein [Butyricimonas faecihominis]
MVRKYRCGVTVRLDSATVGTASDVNGMFRLSLPMEKGTLVFSFVGYKTKKVNFSAATRDTIRVVLEEDVSDLDEVTVVAYGSQKRRLMTSAVSSIKGSEIQELPTHSLESLLQGRMAGVEVNNLSGAPGGGGLSWLFGYGIGSKGEGEDRAGTLRVTECLFNRYVIGYRS